jgi:hypothetical protein
MLNVIMPNVVAPSVELFQLKAIPLFFCWSKKLFINKFGRLVVDNYNPRPVV